MMILRSAPASPFGRKVKIAADLLGLHDEIEVVFADTNDPGNSLRGQNPLGKIPVLILADGTMLYDSRVIVEYLDVLAGRSSPHSGGANGALARTDSRGACRWHQRRRAVAGL